jgi:hypothetical protein
MGNSIQVPLTESTIRRLEVIVKDEKERLRSRERGYLTF